MAQAVIERSVVEHLVPNGRELPIDLLSDSGDSTRAVVLVLVEPPPPIVIAGEGHGLGPPPALGSITCALTEATLARGAPSLAMKISTLRASLFLKLLPILPPLS
jgi:hypothetical protein